MRRVLMVLISCLGAVAATLAVAPVAASASSVTATHAVSASRTPEVSRPDATAICASGWVCILKGDVWDGQPASKHPMIYSWYYYGTYNVYNLVGDYTVFNNQTGGARAALYSGANGTGTKLWDLPSPNGEGLWANLTPVYSVRLYS